MQQFCRFHVSLCACLLCITVAKAVQFKTSTEFLSLYNAILSTVETVNSSVYFCGQRGIHRVICPIELWLPLHDCLKLSSINILISPQHSVQSTERLLKTHIHYGRTNFFSLITTNSNNITSLCLSDCFLCLLSHMQMIFSFITLLYFFHFKCLLVILLLSENLFICYRA